MKSLFVLLLLVTLGQAILQLPFRTESYDFDNVFLETHIGTPAQNIDFEVTLYDSCDGLTAESVHFDKNAFNPRKSSTWKKTGKSLDYGYTGTDNFTIYDSNKKPQYLQEVPFNVDGNETCFEASTFSLARTSKEHKNAFLDSLLANEKDKVVVLTYNNVPKSFNDDFSGLITVGAYPEACSNWHKVSDSNEKYGSGWQFRLDKISAGKFGASDPGAVMLDLVSPFFTLSKDTYHHVVKQLDMTNDGFIPCNTTKDIVFTINGFDLHLTPDEYLDKSDPGKYCVFYGSNNKSDYFRFPVSIFDKYCLLLDFENKMIGFGDLKK